MRTQGELGKALNRSVQAIGGYVSRGMPKGKAGYDVEECREWIAANVRDNKEQKAEKNPRAESQKNWEALKVKEEALTKQLKRKQLRGRLVDRAKVEQGLSELCLRIKHRLEQIPDEMEMSFPAETRADNKRELENKIENILREMSQWEL